MTHKHITVQINIFISKKKLYADKNQPPLISICIKSHHLFIRQIHHSVLQKTDEMLMESVRLLPLCLCLWICFDHYH